jgi:hypothetical protein
MSLKNEHQAYRNLKTWSPMENGMYSAASQKLAWDLTQAGCSAGKIEFAIKRCAETFGIRIPRRFMSARTVAHIVDEGGKYGELQLATEILNVPGEISL